MAEILLRYLFSRDFYNMGLKCNTTSCGKRVVGNCYYLEVIIGDDRSDDPGGPTI